MQKFFFLVICLNVMKLSIAYAEGLPANPWLSNHQNFSASPAENISTSHDQIETLKPQINQAIKEAGQTLQELSQKIKEQNNTQNADNQNSMVTNNNNTQPDMDWQKILQDFSAAMPQSEKSKSSSNLNRSKELYELNRDYLRYKKQTEQKYKQIKNKAYQYYNTAKQSAEELENTLEQNTKDVQKLLK